MRRLKRRPALPPARPVAEVLTTSPPPARIAPLPARHVARLPVPLIALHIALMVALPVVLTVALMITLAPPLSAAELTAHAYLLLEGRPATLASQLEELPVTVRLVDTDRVLLEVAATSLPAVRAALPAARVLGEPLHVILHGMEICRVDRRAVTGEDLRRAGGISLLRDARLWIVALPEPSHLRGAEPLHAAYDLRALMPPSTEELAHPFRTSRGAEPDVHARLLAMRGQVSATHIAEIVRSLAESEPGVPSSRFVGRSGFKENFTDPLFARIDETIFTAPGDTVFLHTFKAYVKGDSVDFHNIVARRPGSVPGSGRYILGAHYDAIASNTPDFDPDTSPSPGADDNGSGVACVMEAARVLLTAEYDFDLELVLFANEERWVDAEAGTTLPGLLGSQRLVADLGYGPDNVLGAIVADMVGYNPRVDSVTVLSNFRSEWLADIVSEANALLPADDALDFATKVVEPTFDRSDHGSFWTVGADGILLIENPAVEEHNPNYDRVTDTYETMVADGGFDQIRRVAEMVVAALGQFSNVNGLTGSVELTSETLFFLDEEGRFLSFGRVGEPIQIRTRLFNAGPELESVTAVVRPTISFARNAVAAGTMIGDPGPARELLTTSAAAGLDTTFVDWAGGTWREVVVTWVPTDEQVGFQEIRFDLSLSDTMGGGWSFSPSGTATVLGSGLRILDAHVRPNPVRGSLAEGALSFQLTERGTVSIEIFDALGREVALHGNMADDDGIGFFDVGLNDPIPLDRIIYDADLPSGIYIARLRADGTNFNLGIAEVEFKIAYMR